MSSRRAGAAAGRFVALVSSLALVSLASPARAQWAAEDPTLHELAARDAVARIAQAINAGVPVDVRNDDGRTALHVAAKEGHLFSAMMLISKGADPNARDRDKRTPLHLVAAGDKRTEGERFQIVRLLLAKGGDPRARDAKDKRPVDYATTPEFVKALQP